MNSRTGEIKKFATNISQKIIKFTSFEYICTKTLSHKSIILLHAGFCDFWKI